MAIHIQRREFIFTLGGAAAARSVAARAQQPAMPVVGFLHYASPESFAHIASAFRDGLREASYVEGQNVLVEYRWANGQYDHLPALAADLVHRQVSAIAAGGNVAAQVAKAATATIPVVFTSGADPVTLGLVASLNRPGGNVTGVTVIAAELAAKRLELLRGLVPSARIMAMLINPNYLGAELELSAVEAAAHILGLQVQKVTASNERDLDAAFVSIATTRVDALIVGTDGYYIHRREQITTLAAHHAVPTMYFLRDFTAVGGLMSYASSVADSYRQMGVYIGKILKGTKPADLPVLRPTKFELVINLKAAKTLRLIVPDKLLALADEVIE
jgi:putative ABC transport system substrate-binding protein